ncbi:uncharacterized protein [Drosophila pseudoobscura]|uniref:Uncharacterized protein isoform X1 n=1 Tax=Drosophila pseudoobscura pseudoobscura TaxID=46245 RepID=A0A6I8UXM4_DROPS|nr:uncharacterized protein LOC6903428 isoform X1 [Drosophila pseudoobscura]
MTQNKIHLNTSYKAKTLTPNISRMLQPQDETHGDGGSAVLPRPETTSEDPSGGSQNGAEQAPDNSISHYLVQVQLSHKQINKRFSELLNLFEGYTKMVDGEQKHQVVVSNPLKRVPSHGTNQNERLSGGTVSERTIQAATCEVSIQTSWSLLEQQKNGPKSVEEGVSVATKEKPSQIQQHTIHIEVESVASATDMQRAPLHQRLLKVLLNAVDAFIGCLFMIGENFPYVLFILLCIWCLYLLLAHYRKFLDNGAIEPPS